MLIIFLTCEELVSLRHICEELVRLFLGCEEVVPFLTHVMNHAKVAHY